MNLSVYLKSFPKAAVAFSGGVDSAYLLYAAQKAGCELHAYFVKSPFQPQFELEDAVKLADSLSIPFTIEYLDVLDVKEVAQNPQNRCYYCKRAIFTRIKELAAQDGYPVVFDGTNASDSADDRPGMKALQELGVVSPLRECGITKAQIRSLSKQAELFTWDKPAYACLATRIPSGMEISSELLQKVERCEKALFALGFSDFRIRITVSQGAKLQLPEEQLLEAVRQREKITSILLGEFSEAVLDLVPRKTES